MKITAKGIIIIFLIITLVSCEITISQHTHEWGEWTVVQSPENGEDGIEERSCACGEKENRPIVAPFASEGLEFTLNFHKDGYFVRMGECVDTDVVIPESYEGLPVVGIGDRAFYNNENIVSVSIPESVMYISYNAFRGCTSLKSVTIPASVVSIIEDAFVGCLSLESIEVNEKNEKYKSVDGVLYSKDGKSLEKYPSGKSATEFIVPDGVESIKERAFERCTLLESVVLPDGLTYIGKSAFTACTSLSSISLPSTLLQIDDQAFEFCNALETIEFSEELTSIGYMAFGRCTALKEVFIPKGISSIGNEAFGACVSLTKIEVDIENRKYQSIDGNLYSKDGSVFIQYALAKTDESFVIPNGVSVIKAWAFEECTSLKSVTLPSTLTELCDGVFRKCTSLEFVNVPLSVVKMGRYVFDGCENLTIYCEAKKQPTSWDSAWNSSGCYTVWDYDAE